MTVGKDEPPEGAMYRTAPHRTAPHRADTRVDGCWPPAGGTTSEIQERERGGGDIKIQEGLAHAVACGLLRCGDSRHFSTSGLLVIMQEGRVVLATIQLLRRGESCFRHGPGTARVHVAWLAHAAPAEARATRAAPRRAANAPCSTDTQPNAPCPTPPPKPVRTRARRSTGCSMASTTTG